jgi:hypothetical protein
MGAHSIISPKPNTQNDNKPIPSIFSRKPEELPASVILLYGSDETEISDHPFCCQQLILFFSTSLMTSRLTKMAMPEIMSKIVQNSFLISDIKKDATNSQRRRRIAGNLGENRLSLG